MKLGEKVQKQRRTIISRFHQYGLGSAGVPPAPSRRPADWFLGLPILSRSESFPCTDAFDGTPKAAVETTALPIPTASWRINRYSSGNSAPDLSFRYETHSRLIKVNQGSRTPADFAPSVNSQLQGRPPCS